MTNRATSRIVLWTAGAWLGLILLPLRFASAQDDTSVQAPDPKAVIAKPKVDGDGYLPGAPKIFYISGSYAVPGAPFQIVHSDSQGVVYRGTLSSAPKDDLASSGELVLEGDFSKISLSGSYQVHVGDDTTAAGDEYSVPFAISDSAYIGLFVDSARTFSLNRCGISVADPVSGLRHPPCHMNDIFVKGQEATRDFTGGWHNAFDYSKWTPDTAIAASFLMWLAELGPASTRTANLQVAESVRGMPDILSEARWGLKWLLKMQRADGSVFHKVDSSPDFALGKRPEDDTNKFYAEGAYTVDAADFTAVMAQASRVYAPYDVDFANQCGVAADLSWRWVKANSNVPVVDSNPPDSDPAQEVFWAQAEMASRLKSDQSGEEVTLLQAVRKRMATMPCAALSIQNPAPFGCLTLASEAGLPRDVRNQAGQELQEAADSLTKQALQYGYGVVLGPKDYTWGSCQKVLFDAATLLFAWHVADQQIDRDCAAEQLHYLLGRNSLNRSFIAGHGANPVVAPFHWTMMDFHLYMSGWASGGPNADPQGADPQLAQLIKQGVPPAKCLVDMCAPDGSWASNQGTITEEGALVFVSGMLLPRDMPKAR